MMRTTWLWILLVVAALFASGCKGEEAKKDEAKKEEGKKDEGKKAGGTPEEQMLGLMDEMTAAFKESDCKKSAEMLGKIDVAAMTKLQGELKDKYKDGPPPEAKAKIGEMVPAMQAAMKNCSADADWAKAMEGVRKGCLLYTSPSPRDRTRPRMPSSA